MGLKWARVVDQSGPHGFWSVSDSCSVEEGSSHEWSLEEAGRREPAPATVSSICFSSLKRCWKMLSLLAVPKSSFLICSWSHSNLAFLLTTAFGCLCQGHQWIPCCPTQWAFLVLIFSPMVHPSSSTMSSLVFQDTPFCSCVSYLTSYSFSVFLSFPDLFLFIWQLDIGVIQESVLEPLLFSLCIQSLDDLIPDHDFKCRSYADDFLIYIYSMHLLLNAKLVHLIAYLMTLLGYLMGISNLTCPSAHCRSLLQNQPLPWSSLSLLMAALSLQSFRLRTSESLFAPTCTLHLISCWILLILLSKHIYNLITFSYLYCYHPSSKPLLHYFTCLLQSYLLPSLPERFFKK